MSKTAIRDIITPTNLHMLQTAARLGSFAAAARELGLVPSALTYRIRAMEEALDVLLFDRSRRQAHPTPAALELIREGSRILADMDTIAHRVQRVATGWEPQLTVVIENLLDMPTVLELCESFYTLGAPTRLKIREEVMTGTLEALTSGQADLALGVLLDADWNTPHILHRPLGAIEFIYAVAPHHPLAAVDRPLTPEDLLPYRTVAVADSVQRGSGRSVGLLSGQDVLTVPDMATKIAAQIRGIGVGHVPNTMAMPYLQTGRLVRKTLAQPLRSTHFTSHYAWHDPHGEPGRALRWWLQQLDSAVTREALLMGRHAPL